MSRSVERAFMPKGSSTILENRSVKEDYSTILPYLESGIHLLDVGCGTGTMTADMARRIGNNGRAIGIDNSEHLIERGKTLYRHLPNLELEFADLFSYQPEQPFDLIVSARVLQWLSSPLEAIQQLVSWLRPAGRLSVLDYDHTAIEFKPDPPDSMLLFYNKFLQWRADAGMNNKIAGDLASYFKDAGMDDIRIQNADQSYRRGDKNFIDKIAIWSQVAASRGKQLVKDQYISETQRLQAIKDYNRWAEHKAELMVMKLKDVQGIKSTD